MVRVLAVNARSIPAPSRLFLAPAPLSTAPLSSALLLWLISLPRICARAPCTVAIGTWSAWTGNTPVAPSVHNPTSLPSSSRAAADGKRIASGASPAIVASPNFASAAANAAAAAAAAAEAADASLSMACSAADRARSAASAPSLLQLEELDTLLQEHQQQLRSRVDLLREEKRKQHEAWYEDIQNILPSPQQQRVTTGGKAGGKAAAAASEMDAAAAARGGVAASADDGVSSALADAAANAHAPPPLWVTTAANAAANAGANATATAAAANAAHGEPPLSPEMMVPDLMMHHPRAGLGGPRSLPGDEELLQRTRTVGDSALAAAPPLLLEAASPPRGGAAARAAAPSVEVGASQRSSLESLTELEALLEEQHHELIARGFIPSDAATPWKQKQKERAGMRE